MGSMRRRLNQLQSASTERRAGHAKVSGILTINSEQEGPYPNNTLAKKERYVISFHQDAAVREFRGHP